ncbi:MAG TPA: site-specific integrase [Verrucomicrobiae bacterium]|nr:site-specific integrase [Verrucomicrobiae bacterium]
MVIVNITAAQYAERVQMSALYASGVLRSLLVTTSSASTEGTIPVPARRFQEGCVVEKSSRRYGIVYTDVLKDDGTFKRLPQWVPLGLVSEQSERAARKQFQPYVDRENALAAKMPRRTGFTLSDFVKEWRASVSGNLKPSTVRAMESHLRAHLLPKLGSLPLTGISTKEVQSFVAYLASGKRSRKTVENVLLTLSSLISTAKSWDYECGNFRFADLTLPREGVKEEKYIPTDEEVRQLIEAASECFGTILAVTAVLCLRIGETLALRVCDIDFKKHVIRIRQSVDAATRTVGSVKSKASSADLPMPRELEARLRAHLARHNSKSDLLFTNQKGRPFSANKLRTKHLHPLLKKLGLPRFGFHALRHAGASALLADGVTPAVAQSTLRHSDARITLGIYGHMIGNEQRDAVQNRASRIVN